MMFVAFCSSNSALMRGVGRGSSWYCISALSHGPMVFMVNVFVFWGIVKMGVLMSNVVTLQISVRAGSTGF